MHICYFLKDPNILNILALFVILLVPTSLGDGKMVMMYSILHHPEAHLKATKYRSLFVY